MSAATVTWDERDSSATSSAGRFLADDFLPLVLDISNAQDADRNGKRDPDSREYIRTRGHGKK